MALADGPIGYRTADPNLDLYTDELSQTNIMARNWVADMVRSGASQEEIARGLMQAGNYDVLGEAISTGSLSASLPISIPGYGSNLGEMLTQMQAESARTGGVDKFDDFLMGAGLMLGAGAIGGAFSPAAAGAAGGADFAAAAEAAAGLGVDAAPAFGGAATGATAATGAVAPAIASAGPAAATGAAAVPQTAAQYVSNLTGISPGALSLAGTLGAVGLGVGGSLAQSEDLEDIAHAENARTQQMMAMGGPYRDMLLQTFQPGFDVNSIPGYSQTLDTANTSLLNRASINGNPALNPGVLAEINKYVTGNVALPAVQNYRDFLAGAGGLTQYAGGAARGPNLGPAIGAADAASNVYGDLGYGLSQVTQPRRPTLAETLRSLT